MSHMVKVEDFQITSLSALKRASARLGYEFRAGQKTARYWNGKQAQVDHAIAIPGTNWEIGVVEEREEQTRKIQNSDWLVKRSISIEELNISKGKRTYSLQADFYGTEGKKMEQAILQLRQYYAVELAKETARRKGYSVREQKLPNGSIKLVVGVGR